MRQRGAIFGLDLRMAIVIGGLMATIISAELLSNYEGDRVVKTEQKIEAVRKAMIDRYDSMQTASFGTTISSLYNENHLDNATAYYGAEMSLQGAIDGWGQNLVTSVFYADKTILGHTVPINFGILVSSGPDKVFQSVTTLTNEATYNVWSVAGDDIGIKFNTVLMSRDRVLLMQQQLQRIMEALNAYAAKTEAAHARTCTLLGCTCGVTCAAMATNPMCDADADNSYCVEENKLYNYFPTEYYESEEGASKRYYESNTGNTFTSGNLTSMQSLMTLIGLPTTFATDAWGRVLRYDSNVGYTELAQTAAVWFE